MRLLFIVLYPIGMQILIEIWLKQNKIWSLRQLIPIPVTITLFLLLFPKLPVFALLIALASGRIAYLASECLMHNGSKAFTAVMLCLGFDSAIWPLLLLHESSWQYILYGILMLMCLAYALMQVESLEREPNWMGDLFLSDRKLFWCLSLLPCIVIFIAIITVILFAHTEGWQLVAGCGLILVVQGLVVCIQRLLCQHHNLVEDNRIMTRSQMESRDYMNTIRSQRHDFNLHLHAISGLIDNKKYDDCRQYIQNMVDSAADVNDIMPVYDAVIGSMLQNMRKTARQKGTDIVYNIKYDMKDVVCNAFECNKVIGNLIQNALDAVQSHQEKSYGVRVSIFKRRGNTVISVSNYFEGDMESLSHVFDSGYSTKKNHEGIGLSTTEKMLNKYSGRVYMEWNGKVVTFFANIPNRVSFKDSRA